MRALAVHNTSCNTTRPARALAADHTKTTRHHRRNQDTSSPRLCKGQAMARGGAAVSRQRGLGGVCAVCAGVPYAVPLPVSCVSSLCVVTVCNMRRTTRRRSEDARCDYLHVHVMYFTHVENMNSCAAIRHPWMASSWAEIIAPSRLLTLLCVSASPVATEHGQRSRTLCRSS